jgi:hypothetical protein
VTFAGPASGAGVTFPGGTTATTGASGQAGVAVTANTTVGGYTVTATTAGVAGSASFGLTTTAGAPTGIALVSGDGQSAVVNTTFTGQLVVQVTDGFGNPVSGTTVTFAGPASGAGVTFPSGSTPTTNANGQAGVTVKANTLTGDYTVTATTAGVPGGASFGLTNTPGAPTGIAVVSGGGQSATVGTAFSSPLVAKVTDGFGNPISGVTVTFAGPAAGAGVTFPGGATATTDASGRASVAVAAGTVSGAYAVTASAPGVSGSA